MCWYFGTHISYHGISNRRNSRDSLCFFVPGSQQAHGVIMTSYRRRYDVIMTSCARWVKTTLDRLGLSNLWQRDSNADISYESIKTRLSGDGNVRILRQSCTSGYKYETFRICSLILSNKYFLVSHLKFFHFQGG